MSQALRVVVPVYKSSTTIKYIVKRPSLGSPILVGKWWTLAIVDDTNCLGDFFDEVMAWQWENCDGKRPFDYRISKHGMYVAFLKEEDALLCYLKFK